MGRSARLLGAGAGVASNAVATLAPQVAALVFLTPHDYATFGVLFIALGLAYSAQNSTVIDPWLREGAGASRAPGGPLLLASAGLGVVAALVPWALGYVSVSELGLVLTGLLAAQLRSGLRMIDVGCGRWMTAFVSDSLFLTGFTVAMVVWKAGGWSSVWVPLTIGSALALVVHVRIPFSSARATIGWFADRRRTIAPLWVESAILDMGVAAPALILAKLMPAPTFAVVRAASSAMLPVRLVIAPLRGWIALRRPSDLLRARVLGLILILAVGMGVATAVGLRAVASLSIVRDGVLPLLADYAVPIAAMATLQCLSNVVYLVARGQAAARELLVARIADTVIQLLVIVGGWIIAGLAGAIGAYVLISAASLSIWLAVVVRAGRRLGPVDVSTGV